jgi:ABC-type transport system involved in multi-copper enzyme maturation permease subunit
MADDGWQMASRLAGCHLPSAIRHLITRDRVSAVVIAETVRRCVTSIGYWAFVALLSIISLGLARFDRPGTAWPSMISLLAYIIGCTVVGPEFSSGTLQLILTKPVNRPVYLVSRVAGVVSAIWIAALIACSFELLGRVLWLDGLRVDVVATILLNTLADTLLICALLVFFASFTRAYFNIAIYLVLMIGIGVSQGMVSMLRARSGALGAWLGTHDIIDLVLAAIDRNLFPDAPPRFDGHWLLMVMSNAAIAIVMACFIFRRREVPYGAD